MPNTVRESRGNFKIEWEPCNTVTSVSGEVSAYCSFLPSSSNSAMAVRPCELGDFNGVGEFEAKFWVKGLCFMPMTIRLTYLLAACMQHINIAPRPQSKVEN